MIPPANNRSDPDKGASYVSHHERSTEDAASRAGQGAAVSISNLLKEFSLQNESDDVEFARDFVDTLR
jgi:hypothetical protein